MKTSRTCNRPLEVVVFGSGAGTILKELLRVETQSRCPPFVIRALFTDCQCHFETIARKHHLPLIYHPFNEFFQRAGGKEKRDQDLRGQYDEKNAELLLSLAAKQRFSIDLIFLAGYMRLLYSPLIERFKHKILNVHPADLTEKDSRGRRRYVGKNAVFEALISGKTKTRSSVFFVDAGVDTGPMLVSGPWVPYTGTFPVTQAAAAQHQEKQKKASDFPATIQALKLIAANRVVLNREDKVMIDGVVQGDGGYQMERSVCAES
ncbi:MAG: formyltransferase family protein [Chlamydiota bacterium]